jgi:hypothetical protein
MKMRRNDMESSGVKQTNNDGKRAILSLNGEGWENYFWRPFSEFHTLSRISFVG